MNREILFCGKRKSNEHWIYGYVSADNRGTTIKFIENNFYKEIPVIPETVGQYTGLTDKNGKKIFEHDYCLLTKPCVMVWGVIEYKNACYWFVENKTQADGMRNMIRLCDLESNGYEIQVKGNIHDNPELLEVAK